MSNFIEYGQLLEKFLEHPELSQIIQNLNYHNTLNLISLDWKEKLQNDKYFQDLKHDVTKHIMPSYEKEGVYNFYNIVPSLKVAVIVQCEFVFNKKSEKTTISVKQYSPLTEIGRIILSDLDDSVQKMNDFRLTFDSCGNTGQCYRCSDSAQVLANTGFILEKPDEPCIGNTAVFDGKKANSRFLSQIRKMFSQKTFFAICLVKVNSRYSYKLNEDSTLKYRVSGKLKTFIAFDKRKLFLNKEINLGPLNLLSKELYQPVIQMNDMENLIVDDFQQKESTVLGKRDLDSAYIEAYPQSYKKSAPIKVEIEESELIL